MRGSALGRLHLGLVLVLGLSSCGNDVASPPSEPADVTEAEDPTTEGGAGGAGSEGDLAPGELTGLPGIDRAQELEIRILDARGTGQIGGRPIKTGTTSPLTTGEWLLSDAGSEYEITLKSALLPDGIVRLDGRSAFLVESPAGPLPRFRLYAGHGSFYFPDLPQGDLVVLTPAGPLVTRGAVFTVTVSPDFQVLVTCREGSVYLTGRQNAVAQPGQVLVADRLGRGRIYAMTPNESVVFAERWLTIMSEEASPVLAALLPRRMAEWRASVSLGAIEETRFLALWFREARTILGPVVPGAEAWSFPLNAEVRPSVWHPLPPNPGLLGELP